MIWNAIAGCHCGTAYAEAMTGEVARDACLCHDLSNLTGEQGSRQRSSILEQKQGAIWITTDGQVWHESLQCTERKLTLSNMNKKQPLQKVSVLEALILIHKQEGLKSKSTATSWTSKWREAEKEVRLGTVNSADRRKPKYPRMQVVQNIQWSGMDRSWGLKMTIIIPSVIGRRGYEDEPWERLIPLTTCCNLRQLRRVSGKPSSICKECTADK